mmetsp:Transcript_106545/g.185316  ORF Transcript_106545/g.185316 Transcript_106545/m.185316 type:complete len:217 (+) Transcript_106545:177-827(+)
MHKLINVYLIRTIKVQELKQVPSLLSIQVNRPEVAVHVRIVQLALKFLPIQTASTILISSLEELSQMIHEDFLLVFISFLRGRLHKHACYDVQNDEHCEGDVKEENKRQPWRAMYCKRVHGFMPTNARGNGKEKGKHGLVKRTIECLKHLLVLCFVLMLDFMKGDSVREIHADTIHHGNQKNEGPEHEMERITNGNKKHAKLAGKMHHLRSTQDAY